MFTGHLTPCCHLTPLGPLPSFRDIVLVLVLVLVLDWPPTSDLCPLIRTNPNQSEARQPLRDLCVLRALRVKPLHP